MKLFIVFYILLKSFSSFADEGLKKENEVKNIINERILKWYSTLCSSNTEALVSYILQKLLFYLIHLK